MNIKTEQIISFVNFKNIFESWYIKHFSLQRRELLVLLIFSIFSLRWHFLNFYATLLFHNIL